MYVIRISHKAYTLLGTEWVSDTKAWLTHRISSSQSHKHWSSANSICQFQLEFPGRSLMENASLAVTRSHIRTEKSWILWMGKPLLPRDYKFHGWKSESDSHSVVSDSLRPRGLYSPWNSPSQNTGVGSLSFLQAIFSTISMGVRAMFCPQPSTQGLKKHMLNEWNIWIQVSPL